MRYLSVCSGIEAASVAWHHLGWTPVGFSEIEPFPSAVLAHRFPNVPNFGDMTKHDQWPIEPGTVDLLVGGTPCQSFSVAGLRKGLADPRGNLMLTFLAIAARLQPKWILWENVPGVLSSGGGRDFGSLLGGLGELGYGWAYRVLDAQYVRVGRWPRAVPQRRRRVFVVGCLGDESAPAEVLALVPGLRGDPETRRAAGQAVAAAAGAGAPGGRRPAEVASTLNHAFGDKQGLEDQHALHGAPLFVPAVVGALLARGKEAMGNPQLDAHHYLVHGAMWWDGSNCAGTLTKQNANGSQRMPDKDNLGAVLQPTWPAEVCGTLASASASGTPGYSDQELFAQGASCIVPIQDGRDIAKSQNGIGIGRPGDPGYTLDTTGAQAVAFTVDMQACKGNANVGDGSVSPTLCKPSGNDVHAVAFTQNCREEVRDLGSASSALTGQGTHQQTYIAQPVPFTKSKRAQSNTDDETWVDGQVNPTLSLFDQGDTRATTVAVSIGTDCYNGAITGDVAATMGTPGSSVNASGPTVMSFYATGGSHGLHDLRDVSPAVKVGSGLGIPSPPAIAHTLSAEGHDASEDGTGRGTPLVPVAPSLTASNDPSRSPQSSEVTAQVAAVVEALQHQGYDAAHASTQETNAVATLRALRGEVGEEAFAAWGLGILDSLQPQEVLRSRMHGLGIRCATFSRSWPIDCAISREEDRAAWAVQSVREAQCEGCSPPGWQLPERLAAELGAYLSQLPCPGAQTERLVQDLWRAGEGIGLLRQALSAFQDARRPAHGEGQPTSTAMQVRRLTATECEFLQGFPRGWTLIPWRGKPVADCPDGPRYKALGNSMACNCMAWIGEGIAAWEARHGEVHRQG